MEVVCRQQHEPLWLSEKTPHKCFRWFPHKDLCNIYFFYYNPVEIPLFDMEDEFTHACLSLSDLHPRISHGRCNTTRALSCHITLPGAQSFASEGCAEFVLLSSRKFIVLHKTAHIWYPQKPLGVSWITVEFPNYFTHSSVAPSHLQPLVHSKSQKACCSNLEAD